MDRKNIISQLKEFKKQLHENTPVNKMILFGSRAWGKPHRDSDIDLIIVSPRFRKTKSFERGLGFYKYWNLNYPVDFLCYTPEEFKKYKKQLSLVKEAVKRGIEIK